MSGSDDGARALPSETSVGRVGIRIGSLDQVLPFYRSVIGCRIERQGAFARLSAADSRTLLELHESPDAAPRPASAAGLFHVAIRLPDRPSLVDSLARIRAAGGTLTGASDHLVSEALYLQDPAGNGVELYRDRPRESWVRTEDGRIQMDTLPLDLDDLAAASGGVAREALPAGTDVGHVHLEVTDLDAAAAFYVGALGLRTNVAGDYDGAYFLAAGGYHHHVAVNVWRRRRDPIGDHQGLRWFELVLPDERSRDETVERIETGGHPVYEVDAARDGITVPATTDPDDIEVRLTVVGERDGP